VSDRGRWWRFAALVAITAVVLVPIASPVVLAVQQADARGGILATVASLVSDPQILTWFGNSIAVAGGTVLLAVAIGAPAGYVLARGRSRSVEGFALLVFALQSLPAVILVVPLFVLFASAGLVDSLPGLALIYVGSTAAVAIWTMSTSIAAVPVSLEEAAWLDGCSVLGGFVRVVLPNAVGGVLGTVVLTFLFVWNEYLIAVIFLTSPSNWTVGLGVVSGRVAVLGVATMLPPIVVFAVLHRFFRIGGVAGAVVG
jgi:multiple sugar transport system permease protein